MLAFSRPALADDAVRAAKEQAERARKHAEELRAKAQKKRDAYAAAHQRAAAAKQKMDEVCGRERGQRSCSDATLKWAKEHKQSNALGWEVQDAERELVPKIIQQTDKLMKARQVLEAVSASCTASNYQAGRVCFDGDVFRPVLDLALAARQHKLEQRFTRQRSATADLAFPRRSGSGSSSSGSSGSSSGGIAPVNLPSGNPNWDGR